MPHKRKLGPEKKCLTCASVFRPRTGKPIPGRIHGVYCSTQCASRSRWREVPDQDVPTILGMYESGNTAQEIARVMGHQWRAIRKVLIANRKLRKPGQRRVEVPKNGYRRSWGEGRQELEHISAATQKLGRPLRKGEIVHHVDAAKDNNTPSNLDVLPDLKTHNAVHRQFTKLAFQLVKSGLIRYDSQVYFFSPELTELIARRDR